MKRQYQPAPHAYECSTNTVGHGSWSQRAGEFRPNSTRVILACSTVCITICNKLQEEERPEWPEHVPGRRA